MCVCVHIILAYMYTKIHFNTNIYNPYVYVTYVCKNCAFHLAQKRPQWFDIPACSSGNLYQ